MAKGMKFTEEFPAGRYIVRKGETVDNIYYVKNGEVDVLFPSITGADGEPEKGELLFAKINPGQTFLELEALSDKRAHFDYRAHEDSTISGLGDNFEELKAYLDSDFDLALTVLKNIAFSTYQVRLKANFATRTLSRLEKTLDDYSRLFYRTFHQISNAARKPNVGDLLTDLLKTGTFNSTYRRGEELESGKVTVDRKIPFFKLSEPHSTPQFTRKIKSFAEGEFVCKEGETGDSMYILMEGELEGFVSGELQFEINGEGSVVGELGLLVSMIENESSLRTASIRCKTQSQLMVIDKMDFIPFVLLRREFLTELIEVTLNRAKNSMHILTEYLNRIDEELDGILLEIEKAYVDALTKIKEHRVLVEVLTEPMILFEEQLIKIDSDKRIYKKLQEKYREL
ncbi:cyclic nucleotide-binding domain-containing protein [Candidatus Riflebacteria bacterium]